MSKHTPGPWAVCDDDTSVHSPSQDMIVHTAEMPGDPAMYPQSFEEEEANARLIAAAPEMLEALKAVVRVMGDDPTFDYCKRIIAKAEGR